MDVKKVETYWINALDIGPSQLQKTVVTKKRGIGTYKKKTEYGVLTVYFNNVKLLNHIKGLIEKINIIVYNPPDN